MGAAEVAEEAGNCTYFVVWYNNLALRDSLREYVTSFARNTLYAHFVRESSSVVERFLAKEEVAGSSPVSRSMGR